MNLRNILSAYSKLRQLTDDETALLETLRGLNDTERESLVVALHPDKATTKRASKKSNKSSSKSSRASGMAATIKDKLQQREPTVGGFADDADMMRCSDCGAVPDDNVHHKRTDENYHPFVSASDAASAAERSSANGEAGSITASSEAEKENVSIATGG